MEPYKKSIIIKGDTKMVKDQLKMLKATTTSPGLDPDAHPTGLPIDPDSLILINVPTPTILILIFTFLLLST